MEQGLRDCCRSIRIGKILVESDSDTHTARVVYARFPDDIARRQILLMYPIMSTGNTVLQVSYCRNLWKKNCFIHYHQSHFSRPLMFSKNMVYPKVVSFCLISFALRWLPLVLLAHFHVWKYSHLNCIPLHQITLVRNILARIKKKTTTSKTGWYGFRSKLCSPVRISFLPSYNVTKI